MKKYVFVMALMWMFSAISVMAQAPVIQLVQYAQGLSVPVDIKQCGDSRLFVVEQSGKIKIIKNGVVQTKPFIDLSTKAGYISASERGLLGLAFPPDYSSSGVFYVNYTDPSGDTKVARYQVSAINPDSAVLSSEQIVLTVNQPYSNHNGGDLVFGPDSMLYIGLGDGGSANDPGNRSQNKLEMLGKMLRIDVRNTPTYTIPADNPFVPLSSVLNEIWSIGLRNPWRYSFDRLTGDLWIGDVGQNAYEEIDFEPAGSPGGLNYGWRCYEGLHPKLTQGCQPQSFYDDPIFEYVQSGNGCSVTGGYMYRGTQFSRMYGLYFYADYCSGKIWYLQKVNNVMTKFMVHNGGTQAPWTTFGEDMYGELYIANYANGKIYHIVDTMQCMPVAAIYPSNVTTCATQAVLTTPIAPGFQYAWFLNGTPTGSNSNSLIATQTGTYTVTVIDSNGCTNTSATASVLISPNGAAQVSATDTLVCTYNAPIALSAFPSGGIFSGIGVNGNTFNPALGNLGLNTIAYTLFDSINNCAWTGNIGITVDLCTGMAATNEIFTDAAAFPNPATNSVNITFSSKINGMVNVLLTDVNGRTVMHEQWNASIGQNKNTLTRQDLRSGIYTLIITSDAGLLRIPVSFE